jgi:ubiquinone biosynthesis protein
MCIFLLSFSGERTMRTSRRARRRSRHHAEVQSPSQAPGLPQLVAASSESEQASRRRRSRSRSRNEHAPRPARTSEPRDTRGQIKAFLSGIDTLLRAVEKTAWRVRSLGDQARSKAQYLSDWQVRASRMAETGLVLARVGGAYRLHTTKAAFVSRERAELEREALHADSARRLYELSIRHGGAFLKLGQMLSSRPDLLPPAYVTELSKLQDAAPPVPFRDIAATLERELGKPLSELFAQIEEQPLASASIGQVHRATLHDGRCVALKVQRPDIDVLVKLDMDLLEVFVRALAEGLPPLDYDTIIRETRAMVSAELDYTREAQITADMAAYFGGHAQIAVPEVVRELSTGRVLVTQLMPGEKITNLLDRLASARAEGDAEAGQRLSSILAAVLEAYARQVLEAGVFQADPHPGNLLAHLGDDGACQVTVLDFGCAKQLTSAERVELMALLRAVVMRDVGAIAAAMDAMGFRTASGTRAGLEGYAKAALSQLALVRSEGGAFHSQLDMVSRLAEFGRHIESDPIVTLPDAFVMLGRVFGTLSGLFVHYQPDISATARVLPVLFAAMANSANIANSASARAA